MPAHRRLFSEKQAHDEVRSLKQHKVDYVERRHESVSPELYGAIADEARPKASSGWSHTAGVVTADGRLLWRAGALHSELIFFVEAVLTAPGSSSGISRLRQGDWRI